MFAFFFFFVIANMKSSGGNIKLDRGLFVSMEKKMSKSTKKTQERMN